MGGVRLDQPLPALSIDHIDPFLLIHHWNERFPGGQEQSSLGVGPHPHRGFSPVTMIFKGDLHHRDSLGNDSIVGAGGTQWMNSGSGIVHSERPGKEIAEKGGDFEIVQFWINTPSAFKMEKASYQPLQKAETPTVQSEDGKISIGIVAGNIYDKTSPIKTHSPLTILRLDAPEKSHLSLPVPQTYNALIYILEGNCLINGDTAANDKSLIWFENDGNNIEMEILSPTTAIVLSGEPIEEPLTTYGPFVMNSSKEIMQAVKDYQAGMMGQLNETF